MLPLTEPSWCGSVPGALGSRWVTSFITISVCCFVYEASHCRRARKDRVFFVSAGACNLSIRRSLFTDLGDNGHLFSSAGVTLHLCYLTIKHMIISVIHNTQVNKQTIVNQNHCLCLDSVFQSIITEGQDTRASKICHRHLLIARKLIYHYLLLS